MVIVWLFTLNSSIIDNVLPWLINLIVLQAVCCTDGKHCCPEGTTCDVSSGKCNHGDLAVVDWIEKVPAIITDVICPDGQSKCQTGQTCCKLATGDYGCCPIPKVRNETDWTLIKPVLRGHDWVKEKWPHKTGDLLKKVPIHMKFSMTGKEKKLLYK